MINLKEYIVYDLIKYIDQYINNTKSLIYDTEQRIQKLKHIDLKSNNIFDLFQNINILENTLAYKKVQCKKEQQNQIDEKIKLLEGHTNFKFSSYEDKQMYLDNYVNNNSDNLQINIHANYEIQKDLLEQINKEKIEQLQNEQNKQAIETGNLENLTDEQKEKIQEEILKEEQDIELEQQVNKQLAIFHKKEHPEETLPDFNINTIIEKYNITPLMHDFNIIEQAEYEATNESHISFISDYFPVNNLGISSLIKSVRENIKNNDLNNSVIEIYKYWIVYLKNNDIDYHLYDWRNFNDLGEFIQRKDQELNDNILDNFIIDISNSIIMYDELADKEKREQQFHQQMEDLLLSNKYVSTIDPHLNEFYKAYKHGVILDIQYEDEDEIQEEVQENINQQPKKELYVNK